MRCARHVVLLGVLPVLLACAPSERRAARASPELRWTAPLDRDHPLVGRIWHVPARRFAAEAALVDALAAARYAALGEKHDNPDHHALQARLIDALVARGRTPAVAFEMLDAAQQPAIDRARAEHPGDADAIARAVDWARSGWPPFTLYRPVFAAAARAELKVVAAGLDRSLPMQLARQGASALDPAFARRFGLTEPLPEAEHAALREEMKTVHCGLLPEALLDSMVLIQRARDAQFADRLYAGSGEQGGVLITGNGHARSDRGVPAQLARGFGARALAVGLLEVQSAWREPGEYAAAWGGALPFEYVWFTPRASDEDPCAELRRTHGSPEARAGAAAGADVR